MSQASAQQRRVLIGAGVVLGVFVVAGGTLLGLSLLHHPHRGTSTPTVTATATQLPSQALDVPSSSPTQTTTALPTADQMKDFVVQYLDTATTNQASAWQSLTPRFQAASGGFGSYQRFWGDIAHADASDFTSSPVDGGIAYRVAYTHRDGRVTDDQTRLHLLYEDGRFLIDAEP